jgi:hypothetical protein
MLCLACFTVSSQYSSCPVAYQKKLAFQRSSSGQLAAVISCWSRTVGIKRTRSSRPIQRGSKSDRQGRDPSKYTSSPPPFFFLRPVARINLTALQDTATVSGDVVKVFSRHYLLLLLQNIQPSSMLSRVSMLLKSLRKSHIWQGFSVDNRELREVQITST